LGRRPKALDMKRRHRLMLYLNDAEHTRLQSLSEQLGFDKTELLYEGLHTLFQATDTNHSTEVKSMEYPEHRDNSSLLDGQREPYGRKLGDWRPGDPCKVRFLAAQYANQRGAVTAVEDDHCLVRLRTQTEPVRFVKTDLIYWDDDDETWIMASAPYEDDEDLNSADHP